MKKIFICLPLFVFSLVFSQQDTIVITDYTKVFVEINEEGEMYPITSLMRVNQAGFFINNRLEGQIRICHPDLFVWVNGRLIDNLSGCKIYEPENLFEDSKADILYLSVSSKAGLDQLICDLIIFEELLVVKKEVFILREIRNILSEFVIICLLILSTLLGMIIRSYPLRVSYLMDKIFTFKIRAYEFVNTNFYSISSMYVLSFFSLSLAYIGVYLDIILGSGGVEMKSTLGLLWIWIQLATAIFFTIILKWIVVSLMARLFHLKEIKNFQLFDFLNFNLGLLIPALLFVVLDFVFNNQYHSWIPKGFIIVFPAILILFVLWVTAKFVKNSKRKKLVIISYLCVTEIIPVIILLGWFLK